MSTNSITKVSKPVWIQFRPLVIAIPARQETAVENRPEDHPDYFPVLKALNERRVQGDIVSITSYKPVCTEWHEVHALQLGYYPNQRRTVFALVRFGG